MKPTKHETRAWVVGTDGSIRGYEFTGWIDVPKCKMAKLCFGCIVEYVEEHEVIFDEAAALRLALVRLRPRADRLQQQVKVLDEALLRLTAPGSRS